MTSPSPSITEHTLRNVFAASEQSFAQLLWALAQNKDIANLRHGAKILDEEFPIALENCLPITLSQARIGSGPDLPSCTYFTIFACALRCDQQEQALAQRLSQIQRGVATEDWAMPKPTAFNADERALFDRVAQLAQRVGQLGIQTFLLDLVQWARDETAIASLVAPALAVVHASGRLHAQTGDSFNSYPILSLAARSSNLPALRAVLANASGTTQINDLSIQAHSELSSAHAPGLADAMCVSARSFEGLHILACLEEATAAGGRMFDAAAIRGSILSDYLTSCARNRIAWDELQVGWLLGETPPGGKLARDLPEQPAWVLESLRAQGWDAMSQRYRATLLQTALQSHCYPVLQRMQQTLARRIESKDLWIRKSGDDYLRLTPLATMVNPINPDNAVDLDRFDRCYELLQQLGLIAIEEQAPPATQSNRRGAMHQLATCPGAQRERLLVHLMEKGLDPDIKGAGNRKPSSLLKHNERLSWINVIRSFQARKAAQAAMDGIELTKLPDSSIGPGRS